MQLRQETKRALLQISNKTRQLQEQGSMTTEDLARLRDALNGVASDLGEMVDSSLEDFFKSVGTSVVSAQRDLDRQSLEYGASGAPLPTQFRIPKADARFHFAISKLESKRIGLLLYSSREQQERSQQHEVGFEVTAAPLTPDQLAVPPTLRQAGIAVRELLRQHLASMQSPPEPVAAILRDFDHALCIRQDNGWMIALTFIKENSNDLDLHLVSIPLDIDQPDALGEPTVHATTRQRQPLLAMLEQLGNRQSQWLAGVVAAASTGNP